MEVQGLDAVLNRKIVVIRQVKEWLEILTDFETKNRYEILSDSGEKIGYFAERGSGFMHFIKRMFLRSHRPMQITVWDNHGQELLKLDRPFYWIFSDMKVMYPDGRVIGNVEKRFGIIRKLYDLNESTGNLFARIESPIWKLWTFPILDRGGREIGKISKKWGGVLKEMFTDSDQFAVELPEVSLEQKCICFSTAVMVDLDYFEDNVRNN